MIFIIEIIGLYFFNVFFGFFAGFGKFFLIHVIPFCGDNERMLSQQINFAVIIIPHLVLFGNM